MSKPSVFIGSSNEGLPVARAIQSQLADVGEPELWNERVALGSAVLESLVQALDSFDFATFVLTPDDLVVSRGVQETSARDNVLIELGLFMGRLGRERTFLVCCKDDSIKIPSDLAGIIFATYPKPSDNSKLISAVGPACTKLRDVIEAKGKVVDLQMLKNKVKQQGSDIEVIRFMIAAMLPIWEVTILSNIDAPEQYMVNTDTEWDTFWKDLGDLLGRGFIKQIQPGKRLPRGGLQNVKQYYKTDELGRQYLRLRKQLGLDASQSR